MLQRRKGRHKIGVFSPKSDRDLGVLCAPHKQMALFPTNYLHSPLSTCQELPTNEAAKACGAMIAPPPSAYSEPPAEPCVPPMGRDFPPLHAAVFLFLQVGDVSPQMNFCLSLFFGEIYVSRLLSARESTLLLSPDRRVCSNTESSTLKRGRGTLGAGLVYISADSLLSLFRIPLIA